jgi:hypothetical protein
MARLDVARLLPHTDVKLRSPVNWTAVLFFACLAGLHLFMAASAFFHKRWEGYLSVMLGVIFTLVAIACRLTGRELAILSAQRVVRMRTGTRRFFFERSVPFSKVKTVRLTLLHPAMPESSTIELVCEHEVIECPPTTVPREEALCLAMTMGVRLIKVFGDAYGPAGERLNQLPQRNDPSDVS